MIENEMKPGISLCLICKNEENTLDRCLAAVTGAVDEMIIVDTGSTDLTKSIALRYSDQVFDYVWNNDFSEARNFALARARHEWLLLLDCDEVMAPEAVQALRNLIKLPFDGFLFNLHENVMDYNVMSQRPWEEIYKLSDKPTPKLKLIRNANRVRYSGSIHESIAFTRLPDFKFHHTSLNVFHLPDLRKVQMKSRMYFELEKRAIFHEPYNSNAHFNLLLTYYLRNKVEHAATVCQKLSYIEPRFLAKFQALATKFEQRGWCDEGRCLAKLVERMKGKSNVQGIEVST